jgi:NAD(P)-dependent dehydrogenase (short-subunit alcohol dehydrogenase family)
VFYTKIPLVVGIQISNLTDYTVPAMEVDIDEARQIFETNFFAVVLMCQTFLPLLMKAKGTIVQIGSVSGVRCIFHIARRMLN